MRLVYITLARKILCYGSFPAKVLLGTNAYNSLSIMVAGDLPRKYFASKQMPFPVLFSPSVSWHTSFKRDTTQLLGYSKGSSISTICSFILS